MTTHVAIEADGTITAIYDDELAQLIRENTAEIKRAGAVEPCPRCPGRWEVHMTDGAYLGCFVLRSAALTAEVEYLTAQLFN